MNDKIFFWTKLSMQNTTAKHSTLRCYESVHLCLQQSLLLISLGVSYETSAEITFPFQRCCHSPLLSAFYQHITHFVYYSCCFHGFYSGLEISEIQIKLKLYPFKEGFGLGPSSCQWLATTIIHFPKGTPEGFIRFYLPIFTHLSLDWL